MEAGKMDPHAPIAAIIAPPPTPNGDLHLGHLAGPYLGADVLVRYLKLRGRDVVSAVSADLNQSYVVTTAERLRVDPAQLAARSYADICATLAAAKIEFDVVAMPNADYTAYIQNWFTEMRAAGAFELKQTTVPYDVRRERFMFESYASGRCPVCLSDTKGNICEVCGHPNDATRLFDLHPTSGDRHDPVQMRTRTGLVLDLERWRNPLASRLSAIVNPLRPNLARLIKEILSRPLPLFPITFPSLWGVPAPFSDCDGLVINVWAEMVPGHYYWLERAHAAAGNTQPLLGVQQPVRYIQFLGFDNSFFYAVAHLGLALAAQELGVDALIPDAIITNEFYQLDSFKFSTSQNHLIWGRDFLQDVPVDEARFYFAWSNPETQQSNFSQSEFEAVVAKKYRGPLCELEQLLANLPDDAVPVCRTQDPMALAFITRMESAYEPEHSSLRLAAQTFSTGLDAAVDCGTNSDAARLRALAEAIAIGGAPLVPGAAESIWRKLGNNRPLLWPNGGGTPTLHSQ
jgi:methionyl-tRNA synthetase